MVVNTQARFTRRDYERLPEGFPAQLIDGMLVKEAAPTPWHQWILGNLYDAFRSHAGASRVLFSPVDLFIDDANVYQPDLVVFAKSLRMVSQIREIPIPILVVEVLSESTASYDRGIKARRYLEKGVGEVWLIDPAGRTVEVRTSGDIVTARDGEVARSSAVEGFELIVTELLKG